MHYPKLRLTSPDTIDKTKEKLKRVCAFNAVQKMTQMTVCGLIQSYAHRAIKTIEQNSLNSKIKGANPHRFIYNRLQDMYADTKSVTNRTCDTLVRGMVERVFPLYADEYCSNYALSVRYQSMYSSLAEPYAKTLHEAAMKVFAFKSEPVCHVMADVSVIESMCRGMSDFIYASFASMKDIARNSCIKVNSPTHDRYTAMSRACQKYFSGLIGDKELDDHSGKAYTQCRTDLAMQISDSKMIQSMNESTSMIVRDFVAFSLAKLTIDYGSKCVTNEVWSFIESVMQGERSISVLKRDMTKLNKSGITDVDDMIEYMEHVKHPVIDVLKSRLVSDL